MTRIGLAPVLGYLILEEDFNVALGVFALAGLTDLVSYEYVWFFCSLLNPILPTIPLEYWKDNLSMSVI